VVLPVKGGLLMGPRDELAQMTNNDVLTTARDVHVRMMSADRDSENYQELLVAWREVCQELNRRGMTDTVTEGDSRPAPWRYG
jgi:hypothetical protein